MHNGTEVLFISDLHLDPIQPDISLNFLEFLKTRAKKARVLYILGDLFEAWLGDDDDSPVYIPVLDALTQATRHTQVYFMHGNRDFLVGQDFAAKTGIAMIDEPHIIDLGQLRIGLMHGDLLCTDDIDYQNFRGLVRDPGWQSQFLAQDISARRQVAARLREKSAQAMADKTLEIMDVNQQEVLDTFDRLELDVLIHGHTHRPGIHQLPGKRARIVLGDWHPLPSVLSWESERFSLQDPRVSVSWQQGKLI